MPTGDGLLVRVHPPLGRLTRPQAAALAEAAGECGNGEIDVTARGNLQLRGIRPDAIPGLAARLGRVGLAEPAGPGPHRLTVTSPLAGIDPADRFDAAALAAAIEATGAGIEGLPAKTAIVVDGGGTLPLDGREAEIRLVARPDGRVAVGLGGPPPVSAGVTTTEAAPELCRRLLETLARLNRRPGSVPRRLRDLPPETLKRLAEEPDAAKPPAARSPASRAGAIPTDDGLNAVLVGLPFGRCDAAKLRTLGDLARRYGAGELRLSFTRGIVVAGCPSADLPVLLAEIARMGLIVDEADPRLAVDACPGRPACASGLAPVRSDAIRFAEVARAGLAGGASLHVSGCPKGCARPGAADLTLVGQPGGGYGIVLGGRAQDPIATVLPADAIAARLATATGIGALASAFGARP